MLIVGMGGDGTVFIGLGEGVAVGVEGPAGSAAVGMGADGLLASVVVGVRGDAAEGVGLGGEAPVGVVGVAGGVAEGVGVGGLVPGIVVGEGLGAAVGEAVDERLPEWVVGPCLVAAVGMVEAEEAPVGVAGVGGDAAQLVGLGGGVEGLGRVGVGGRAGGAVGQGDGGDGAELPCALVAGGVAEGVGLAAEHAVSVVEVLSCGGGLVSVCPGDHVGPVEGEDLDAVAGDEAALGLVFGAQLDDGLAGDEVFLAGDESGDASGAVPVGDAGAVGAFVAGIVGGGEAGPFAAGLGDAVGVGGVVAVAVVDGDEGGVEGGGATEDGVVVEDGAPVAGLQVGEGLAEGADDEAGVVAAVAVWRGEGVGGVGLPCAAVDDELVEVDALPEIGLEGPGVAIAGHGMGVDAPAVEAAGDGDGGGIGSVDLEEDGYFGGVVDLVVVVADGEDGVVAGIGTAFGEGFGISGVGDPAVAIDDEFILVGDGRFGGTGL